MKRELIELRTEMKGKYTSESNKLQSTEKENRLNEYLIKGIE